MKSLPICLSCLGFVLLIFGSAEACMKKFKRSGDIEKISKDCLKKVGLAEMPSTEDMSKPDFDDKCLAKCILGALDMIDDQGSVDSDTFMQFLEENAPKPLLPKLTENAATCSESSESKAKGTKKGETPAECKAIRHFYGCFSSAADKLC